jgi:hypothetical protein
MVRTDNEQARDLARRLLELLEPYEEDLIRLESRAPEASPLRRAVGMAIAEACYLISDGSVGQEGWTPPAKGGGRP